MNKLKYKNLRKVLILDGATGTNLFDKGLGSGEPPCVLNLKNPRAVYELQRSYIEAGSDVILTNTLTANPLNFTLDTMKKVIFAGVGIAKRAAKGKGVLGDIGPIGDLIKPYGDKDFNEVMTIYESIFKIFYQAGIKDFLIETFNSIIEGKAAFLASRKYFNDVFVSFSLQDNGRTFMGEIPEAIAVTFDALGATGIGINCTLPEIAIEAISRMSKVTNLPLLAKPNAGKVEIIGNVIHHTISDKDLAAYFREFVNAGAALVGGCCGTTPEYIRLISKNRVTIKRKRIKRKFILTSPQKILTIDNSSSIIVGERLNPAGCKKVKERLLIKDFKVYGEEARAQEEKSADALDVNAFTVDLNEKESLLNAVHGVLKSSQLPLFIDTQNFAAAEAVLSFYPGVGVYNSIPSRKEELKRWLPMIKNYGFKAVISLVGKKIPRSYKERMANVNLVMKIAKKFNFSKDDLIFDALVFAIATEQDQIDYTLKTVRILHKRGLKTILGVSNVSFGLPNRSLLNATLASAGIEHGAAFLIINPLDDLVMNVVKGAKILFKGEKLTIPITEKEMPIQESLKQEKVDLIQAIITGDDRLSSELSKRLLTSGIPPQTIIDDYISKALKQVGDYYEQGKFFIPDLLKAAEASKAVLDVLKRHLPKEEKKGKIILATVKGDIHDIGKNIAGMVFESAGYEIIDLGKDVPAEVIVKAVKKNKPIVLGLSALLTTTMSEMENIIKKLRAERLNVKVIIGGPNVSEGYAKKIGAYGAARNVLAGLRLLQEIK